MDCILHSLSRTRQYINDTMVQLHVQWIHCSAHCLQKASSMSYEQQQTHYHCSTTSNTCNFQCNNKTQITSTTLCRVLFSRLFICERDKAKNFGWIFMKFWDWVENESDEELILEVEVKDKPVTDRPVIDSWCETGKTNSSPNSSQCTCCLPVMALCRL